MSLKNAGKFLREFSTRLHADNLKNSKAKPNQIFKDSFQGNLVENQFSLIK